jgi:SAM-dependent methyltransferase
MNANTPKAPTPFSGDAFDLLRHGIYDDDAIGVFVNADRSFAVLDPSPTTDYTSYVPRNIKLGLSDSARRLAVIDDRLARIADLIPSSGALLEVGAGDGGFCRRIRESNAQLRLVAVEPDRTTRPMRDKVPNLVQYDSLADARTAGERADTICLFHVFEHVLEPRQFIADLFAVATPGARLIIEIPSLDDPLLSLYHCDAYEKFYFQRQHPYVYSARGLQRALEDARCRIVRMIPYQRYGLANHLTWLSRGKPGGDARLAAIFAESEANYRAALERAGTTDTVIAVVERAS